MTRSRENADGARLDAVNRIADNAAVALKAPIASPTFTGTVNGIPASDNASALSTGTLPNARLSVGAFLGAAFLADVTNGTGGPSSTSNTLRRLNTVFYEVGFGVTLSSNQWTFDNSGSYLIQASAQGYKSNRLINTLYSNSGNTLEATGTSEYGLTSNGVTNRSFIFCKLTISSSHITGAGSVKSFGIYTIVNATDVDGFGLDAQDSTAEQFAQVQIFKIQE